MFQTSSYFYRLTVISRCLVALFLLSVPLLSHASTLAIVSDRSVSTLVGGAHRFLEQQPEQTIQIRTVSQMNQLGPEEFTALIKGHKQLVMIAVFGELVERLLNQTYPPNQARWVMQGDRRLLSLNHIQGQSLFAGLHSEELQSLIDAANQPTDVSEKQAKLLALPVYSMWLDARDYWTNRSIENAQALFSFIHQPSSKPPLDQIADLRFYEHQHQANQKHLGGGADTFVPGKDYQATLSADKPIVWLIDHDTGDRPSDWALHTQLCEKQAWQCVSVLANWGAASVEAVRVIANVMSTQALSKTPWLMVSLQDFVIGGGEGREAVSELLSTLNVPVLKGIRLTEWTQGQWGLSSKGLPTDSVHYRIAMPELQGIGQASILAVAAESHVDLKTGAHIAQNEVLWSELSAFQNRIQHWLSLQTTPNADKKVAVIYYNHPPGRHNIGADNLNVPESLFHLLQQLKAAGYNTGDLPANSESLLDLLQAQGVNLPNDKSALAKADGSMKPLPLTHYQHWFTTLPDSMQAEMVHGPLAYLHAVMKQQLADLEKIASLDARQEQLTMLSERMVNSVSDMYHALDGVRHKGRQRALDMLDQLQAEYSALIELSRQSQALSWRESDAFVNAIIDMKIEGLRGWGAAPGNVMVWNEQFIIPGIRFGNVFLGPQPPRGWEINEELLHANMSFPPPHQYLAFYLYLREVFGADALVHVGRHSTYEFLPKRSVGLGETDYPGKLIGGLPSIYPYIVDGVGEGIQAKRRGSAVMIDHLTPPLAITELYDDLLVLRQLIESAEAASDALTKSRAVSALKNKIDELDLKAELEQSMNEELQVRGIGFDQIDDEFLLHEVGHYLTNIQEQFMPLGLHTFGRDWQDSAVDTMLASMSEGIAQSELETESQTWRANLVVSPKKEMAALLNALSGHFVLAGKGNDPIRTPDALPTGRNFYALDGGMLPTQLGYQLGRDIALQTPKAETGMQPNLVADTVKNKQAIILWASDTVRDEGAMIGFGMALLGVKPIWNSRGIVKGLARLPLAQSLGKRHDVLFTTSGLFRDLYGKQIHLLDQAVLMALDASADLIYEQVPILRQALDAALLPLGELRQGGKDPLANNIVAANWLAEAQALLASQGQENIEALGRQASLRIFGTAPGSYGAGINRLVERSGAWTERQELGQVYVKRMGHAYGLDVQGIAAKDLFSRQLEGVGQTFLGRASNLYGLIDNNDAFDYLGGLNMAIETITGKAPSSTVISHRDAQNINVESLPVALLAELKGRYLNPQWITPLMHEGYAGARTMGSEFVEYLWGWQVTSPDIINDKVWQSVKSVYIDDSHNLGLDQFLAESHNRSVQTNILAVMLTAIDKGFWQASEDTIAQLSEHFSRNIIEHGIPGSGHTHANHPVYEFVKAHIDPQNVSKLEQVLAASRLPDKVDINANTHSPSHIQELSLSPELVSQEMEAELAQTNQEASSTDSLSSPQFIIGMLGLFLTVLAVGIWRGRNLR